MRGVVNEGFYCIYIEKEVFVEHMYGNTSLWLHIHCRFNWQSGLNCITSSKLMFLYRIANLFGCLHIKNND